MIHTLYSTERRGVYYHEKNGKIQKLECDGKTINTITKRIMDRIDEKKVMEKVIKDSLRDVAPKQIDSIKKELDKKEKIKTKPGCVELVIGKELLQIR